MVAPIGFHAVLGLPSVTTAFVVEGDRAQGADLDGLLVLRSHALAIDSERDVLLVRRAVRAIAQSRGFHAYAIVSVTTAASEIARNVWRHAERGTARIEELSRRGRFGIRLEFADEGPGIADIPGLLGAERSLGLGIIGSRRMVDEFTIESTRGKGTLVRMVKWTCF